MSRETLTPAQRSAAVDRIRENLALLSGAGCGKTLVLARRFTELLMRSGGDANPLLSLVALTFTDKAALEMLDRVRKLLAEYAERAKGDDRRKLLGWLQDLPEARIATIHSFCASMLRRHAVEAGIDPDFSVCADELVSDRMLAEATDQAVLAAVQQERRDVAELLNRVSYDEIVGQVRTLVEMRTACDLAAYREPKDILAKWQTLCDVERQAAWKRLEEDDSLRENLREAEAAGCSDPDDLLSLWRDEQLEHIRRMLKDPKARAPDSFALLNAAPGTIGSAKAWGGKDAVKEVRDRLKDAVRLLQDHAVYAEDLGDADADAARSLAALARLAAEADALYAAEKRRRGVLDFTDLLACAGRLLRENQAARDELKGQIDQLLVDEAQDTDGFQISLLERLAFGEERPARPPDGRLFLVGDAKQSIYRFRGAQVEVFEDLCRRLGKNKREDLVESFRTHDAGAAFVNGLFGPLMGADYGPIKAHRRYAPRPRDGGTPADSVEILLAAGEADSPMESAGAANRSQAALTAQRIAEMISAGERIAWDEQAKQWRPVRAGDIAVLFARMTNSLSYERELALREVPYYVVAGTGFFNQQEVYDLLNALRVIENPMDDLALTGVLRSSLFGLDDNALMRVAEAMAPPYLPKFADARTSGERRGTGIARLSENDRAALEFAMRLLASLHRAKDAMGIDAVLERLLDATGYEAALLCQRQGRRMVGNVRRLAELARQADAGGLSLPEFLAQMNEFVIDESRFEQAAVAGEAENVVRLMTIHKAKGLEFPVVFVPDLNAGRRGFRGSILNRTDWGLTCKLKPAYEDNERDDERELPLSFRLALAREDEDQRKEDVRKLYVAVTRHKDHLVLVGADWRDKGGGFTAGRGGAEPYLRQIDEVLGIAAAMDQGRQVIPYGNGKHQAIVRRACPGKPAPGGRTKSLGRKMLAAATSAADLAEEILKAVPKDLEPSPLAGPLPPGAGRAELTVTALSDFEQCPMLFRWRHELSTPAPEEPSKKGAAGAIGAATLGTIYHRCMELLDYRRPQDPPALVRRAWGELDEPLAADADAVAEDLRAMLRAFRSHELYRAVADARAAFRELDFATESGPAVLRGQIDLLFQDAAGQWRIVDYKSDRVEPDELASRAPRYELQMLLYSEAARRHLGQVPTGAVLYFLRPARAHAFSTTDKTLQAVSLRAARLVEELVVARRTGRFEMCRSERCRHCPYGELCENRRRR